MNELILTIATTLSVAPIDVYVLGVLLVFWIVFMILGIQRTYEAYFGLIVGLAIYLMLTVLLSPVYQTPETVKIFSPKLSQFLIGSSSYLMFILFLLTPISGGIRLPEIKTRWLRFIEHAAVAIFVWVLFSALIIGFASKAYIFNVETAFTLLNKTAFFQEVLGGKIGTEFILNLQSIVLFGVFFLLYKMLFSDIAGVIVASIWLWILSLRMRSNDPRSGGDDHGSTLDVHDNPWFDDHGWHDEHSGGGHH